MAEQSGGISGVATLVPPLRRRGLLAVLPLSTGAAVLVFLLTKVSLALSASVLVTLGIGSWVAARRKLSPGVREHLRARVRIGLLAGVAATVTYNVSRYGITAAADMTLRPFRPLALFGEAFIGSEAPLTARYVVGVVYHVFNGLGFAVAYAIVVPRAAVWSALTWALVLELATIALYPDWLKLDRLGEFATVSVLSHIVYGLTLGAVAVIAERRRTR